MYSSDVAYSLTEGDTDGSTSPAGWRLVITSPGTIDMVKIAALARALDWPVAKLAKAIYQAPTVLARGLSAQQQADLVEACATIGVAVVGQPDDQPFEPDLDRFDVAVHVVDPTAIPNAVAVVASLVGVAPDHAYQMLATPPGSIIGDVSTAAVSAVKARFGPGVQVSVAASGAGPFDAVVAPSRRPHSEIERLCGAEHGFVRLGLHHNAAKTALERCPRGSIQLIARDLVRCDVILERDGLDTVDLNERAVAWLSDNFGVDADLVPALMEHAPIALAEGVEYAEAAQHATVAGQLGFTVAIAPAGFGRFEIIVVDAADVWALRGTLDEFGLAIPDTLPATIATDLSDLDARWLAHRLDMVGATIVFQECA